MLRNLLFACVTLAAAGLGAGAARAQEQVQVGLIAVLSGPQATLGKQVRDGFQLGLDTLGGKFGGLPAQVTVIDDELKPDLSVTKIRDLLDSGKVSFVVGPVFSNILQAIFKPVTEGGDLFGATVQLSARLCGIASPGGIAVSAAVRDLCVGKLLGFDAKGEVDLKGFAEPVAIFEVRL